jgi:uncharacterized glyoxalase superfamily protein PhnB
MDNSAATLRHIVPILRVESFERSLAYYRDVLGFSLDWQDGGFGCIVRDDATLFLSEGAQGCLVTWLWVGASDVDVLYEELLARGARIRVPPTNYPWGSRELHVFDLDGHVLRFGSDHRPGEPPGVWIDEQGIKWLPSDDGSWSRQISET